MSLRTAPKSQARFAAEMAANAKTIVGYKSLYELAADHGLEYEVDRLSRIIDEYLAEQDAIIEEAAEAGWAPEDFE